MADHKWGKVSEADKREQRKLIYDYIKFHIALYLATPAALAVIADGFGVKQSPVFGVGLVLAIVIYLAAGIHAGLFMSRQVNHPWQADYLTKFEAEAFSKTRRRMHHSLYWLGLALGLAFLSIAVLRKYEVL